MLIGEVRDEETAGLGMRAALTGHLVFSTVHTNDAIGVVVRLRDLGVENFIIASTIRGVVSQRLLRLLCPHCKQPSARQQDWNGIDPATRRETGTASDHRGDLVDRAHRNCRSSAHEQAPRHDDRRRLYYQRH